MTRVSLPNIQPISKPDYRPDGSLDVVSVWKTIQGEGPFSGCSAIFVRLYGCNLQCPTCDSDYTSRRVTRTVNDLVELMEACRQDAPRLAVLTGGEPFRQNVAPLAKKLHGRGWIVQVETNGTTFLEGFPYDHNLTTVVCSPKTPLIDRRVVGKSCVFKYVVTAGQTDPTDGLPLSVLGNGLRPFRPWEDERSPLHFMPQNTRAYVLVHPADEQDDVKNAANLKEAVRVCQKYHYRLGVQLHKIAGLE